MNTAASLILAALASSCSSDRVSGVSADVPPFTFETVRLDLGPGESPTVLTGFLYDGALADVAVVDVDEHGAPRLSIHGFDDGTWSVRLAAKLRPDVTYVDVARIGGRDRLLAYGGGRLTWFDPESASERELFTIASDYDPRTHREVPHVDITRDLNGDEHDDLVVPHGHGFQVFVQRDGGAFADPVRIGPSTGMGWTYEPDGYRHDPWVLGRVHRMDYDRDGRADLVFWDGDHFDVHRQDEQGLFEARATTFRTAVAFDSDELASLAAPYGFRRRLKDHYPEGDMTGRVLHSLADMNGDGVGDLVVFALEGESLWKPLFTYEVHFGAPSLDGGTVFAPEVGTSITSAAILYGMGQHDFDHDGQVDLTFNTFAPGLFEAAGMLVVSIVTGTVTEDLEFYRMEDGVYSEEPSLSRKIKVHPGDSGKRKRYPATLIGDVNGDGRQDLILQKGKRSLRVYLGVPGSDLFARKYRKVKVPAPIHEKTTWLADLDGDGRQDVVVHHAEAKEQRVTMLIAR